MRFPVLALLTFLLLTGCDSTEESAEYNADFVVGTWTFASLRDDNGSGEVDRTDHVLDALDSFQITFASNGQARIIADLTDRVNAGGSNDIDTTVEYSVGESTLTLSTVTVDADARNASALDLAGSGAFISQLLGLDLELDLSESATLGLTRR